MTARRLCTVNGRESVRARLAYCHPQRAPAEAAAGVWHATLVHVEPGHMATGSSAPPVNRVDGSIGLVLL